MKTCRLAVFLCLGIVSLVNAGIADMEKFQKSEEELKNELTPEEYQICILKGTEKPFTGKYHNTKDKGVYRCTVCNQTLFSSETKFDSGTGWPSFWQAMDQGSIKTHEDTSRGMARVEVACSHCGAHLGHVFDDGPPPTYKRYCINSLSLKLDKTA